MRSNAMTILTTLIEDEASDARIKTIDVHATAHDEGVELARERCPRAVVTSTQLRRRDTAMHSLALSR